MERACHYHQVDDTVEDRCKREFLMATASSEVNGRLLAAAPDPICPCRNLTAIMFAPPNGSGAHYMD